MSKPIIFADGTIERMKILLKKAKRASELKRIQCVLMGASQLSSTTIAPIVGHTPEYIRFIWKTYRQEGESFLLGEKRGGRNNALLTFEEEEKFISPYLEKAKEGGILIVSKIKKDYEEKLGRKVHHPVIYNLLHRHGWRKIAPRPFHPKTNTEAQEEFKTFTFPPERNKCKN